MDYKDVAQSIVRGNYSNLNGKNTFHSESFIYKKTNEKLNEFIDLLVVIKYLTHFLLNLVKLMHLI